MWVLEIKQRVPRDNYYLDEKVTFKSNDLIKFFSVISNLESNIETEFIIKREEDNDAK